MDKRLLLACLAALAVMLGFDLATLLSGRALDLPVRTGWGTVPVIGLLVTALAMAAGGWVARRGFRIVALLLAALVWLCVVTVVELGALSSRESLIGLTDILRHSALAMVLSLVAAWSGAALGERIARHEASPSTAT